MFVCENLAFQGDYSPVSAKHTKNFGLQDSISVGVDGMQRNFEPMRRQVEAWRASRLSDDADLLRLPGSILVYSRLFRGVKPPF